MYYPKYLQTTQDVAHHYDDLSSFYLKFWGEHVHHGLWQKGTETETTATEALAKYVALGLRIEPGQKVLDIGCGYGGTSRIFAKEGAHLTSLTISKEQHDYAKKTYPGDNPTYLLEDWMNNNQPSNTFDAAFSIESSEHMPDKELFFQEIQRVLKPKGKLAVLAWLGRENVSSFEESIFLEPICREGRLPSIGTRKDYESMMRDAGFTNIHYEDLTKKVRKTWWILSKRASVAFFRDKELRNYLRKGRERLFAKTLLRMLLAYQTRALQYGAFFAECS